MSSRLNATFSLVCFRASRFTAPLPLSRTQEHGRHDPRRHHHPEGVRTIARQPGIGRPAEDIEPEYREWPFEFGESGYVVRYRYHQQTAVILAVRHQREAGY